jgi:transcriptional regulator with PAS, ATPase and Fis domain
VPARDEAGRLLPGPGARELGRLGGKAASSRTLRSAVSEIERQVIAGALERHQGNKAKVARELGLSYPTLLSRIRAFGLEGSRRS